METRHKIAAWKISTLLIIVTFFLQWKSLIVRTCNFMISRIYQVLPAAARTDSWGEFAHSLSWDRFYLIARPFQLL